MQSKLNKLYNKLIDGIYSPKFINFIFFGLLLCLSFLIRLSAIKQISGDYTYFLSPWFDYIQSHGYFLALKDDFANYAPPYLYFLVGSVYLVDIFGISKIVSIKLVAILFDYFLAFWVFKVVKFIASQRAVASKKLQNIFNILPFVAAFTVLFSPNVVLNSSVWGQCDVIYTSFLVMALYYLLQKKYTIFLLGFGIALTFKLQAVFFAPLILVLFLSRKINIFQVFIPLISYVVAIIPAALVGRNFWNLLTIYLRQANTDIELTISAPTFYQWFGNVDFVRFNRFAMVLAVSATLGISYLFWQKRQSIGVSFWLHLSLLSGVLIPFLLPKMHERYFFGADIISIIYIFGIGILSLQKQGEVSGKSNIFNSIKNRFWVPIVINLVSFFSYAPYVFGFNYFKFPDLSFALLIVIIFVLSFCFQDLGEESSL